MTTHVPSGNLLSVGNTITMYSCSVGAVREMHEVLRKTADNWCSLYLVSTVIDCGKPDQQSADNVCFIIILGQKFRVVSYIQNCANLIWFQMLSQCKSQQTEFLVQKVIK